MQMQFCRGKCSGFHHASVRSGDLLEYFLLSLRASPTITNLFFLLSVLSLLFFITGFHHNCWQKFSISLWRTVELLALPICSGKRLKCKPCWGTVLFHLELHYSWPSLSLFVILGQDPWQLLRQMSVLFSLWGNLELPCFLRTPGRQHNRIFSSWCSWRESAGVSTTYLGTNASVEEKSVPAVHCGEWIEGDFYMLPQFSTGRNQNHFLK